MELHAIAVRAVSAWILLVILLRLSSKESVAELSGRALVLTIIMSDLIDDFLFAGVTSGSFIAAAGTLMLVSGAVALGAVHSERLYSIIEGNAPRFLDNGALRRKAMRRQRINEKELEELLRLQGVERSDWVELQSVRLERSGQASAIKHDWARPLQRGDLARRKPKNS